MTYYKILQIKKLKKLAKNNQKNLNKRIKCSEDLVDAISNYWKENNHRLYSIWDIKSHIMSNSQLEKVSSSTITKIIKDKLNMRYK